MKPILWTLFVVTLFAGACQIEDDVLFDFDGDGARDQFDCRPNDPGFYPGAPDFWGNGEDENCDGVDGTSLDEDGDGYGAHIDCDDRNSSVYPGAEDLPGDGVDSDCDRIDGLATDADGDGFHTGFDCNDDDATIYPGADDPEGDDIDQNCDQVEGEAVDADGDGRHSGIDCDDNNPDVHPGQWDQPLDGIDADCDGLDGTVIDNDSDGFSSLTDCNDEDASVHPGATEVDGDGVDQNCDGLGGSDCSELQAFDFQGGAGDPDVQFSGGPNAAWSFVVGEQSHSGDRAMYYGNLGTGNFDFGINSGELWTSVTASDTAGPHSVTFWVFLDVDDGMTTDQLDVSVMDADGTLATWNKLAYDFSSPATWQQQGLWLPELGTDYDPETEGHQLKVHFAFDSVDDSENEGQGVFLDDLVFSACDL
ncbi:MAG TPA: hypothetical protein DIU15_17910 [Deltaproteobacteria bacterium]|nr:hypothetical protein [Deltaproteobacteria bacterium]HCP47920.1 hypothetical protein [Deltaproteobacteria bacterium]